MEQNADEMTSTPEERLFTLLNRNAENNSSKAYDRVQELLKKLGVIVVVINSNEFENQETRVITGAIQPTELGIIAAKAPENERMC